jgi:serine/threonine protein kinase
MHLALSSVCLFSQLVECSSTRKQYVLKCISLTDQTDRERLLALREVETLKRLQHPKAHPFIVKYHENFLYQDALYIVMQYCSGGDLHHFLRERKQTAVFLEETVRRTDWTAHSARHVEMRVLTGWRLMLFFLR